MIWAPIVLSLKLAALVSVVLLIVGLPIAYWLAYSRFRGKFLVESVVALPLVLPPTVLGFYFLVAAGPATSFGRWYRAWTGHTLAFTFAGLVVASVLYSLPFAVQPFAAAFASLDRRLLDAARVLGASRWRAFHSVIAPLSMGGIITGVVLSFAHTLGEFGVVLMVGGSIPGETRTASIAIYDKVQAFDDAAAGMMSATLLALSVLALAIVHGLARRGGTRRHG